MANIQAIGIDGLTTIYLAGEGLGTNVDPFKSIVKVDNFPATFAATQSGGWTVDVNNFPSIFNIGNFPASQTISGSVSVSNFPSSYAVTGTFWQATQPVSLAKIPLPSVTSATILTLTTAATGTNYTAFSDQVCNSLDLVNNTGTTIEYRRNGAGSAMQLPDKSGRLITGITNASEISVRRTDTSNTQVTVQAEAFQ